MCAEAEIEAEIEIEGFKGRFYAGCYFNYLHLKAGDVEYQIEEDSALESRAFLKSLLSHDQAIDMLIQIVANSCER